MRLEALQQAMVAAIDGGPDHIPEGAFAGGRAAALRGLAVHANTISHARLVALEDTFPRMREALGHGPFNALSRCYVETQPARAEPLATIGRHFPEFLASQGNASELAGLAAFEWAWLESYHAAEAGVLDLAELAGMDEAAVLAMPLVRHPAAGLTGPAPGGGLEADVPSLAGAAAILLTRPDADVLVAPATRAMVRLFAMLGEACEVVELFAAMDDGGGMEQEIPPALIALIEAGAVIRADRKDR